MPGFFLTAAATVQCPHQGPIMIAPIAPIMFVAGSPVLTSADVAALTPAQIQCPNSQPKCLGLTWNNVASAVTENGSHVLLVAAPGTPGDGLCSAAPSAPGGPPVPTGPPKSIGVQTIAEGV